MNIQPFIDAVVAAGGGIYAVGGSVRDEILGFKSKDLDVLVTGIPYRQLSSILANLGTVDEVGKSFGVIKFRFNGEGEEIDVALPRTERSTGEGHCDFDVNCDHMLPIGEDLLRRDFTINAMARNLVTGELVDPYGGLGDCKTLSLVPVSDQSFSDDPLRILRGIQFAARFGLNTGACRRMMARHAADLRYISPERIAVELGKLFNKAPPDRIDQALAYLTAIGANEFLFGGDGFYRGSTGVSYAPADVNVRLALVLYGSGYEKREGDLVYWAEEVIDRLKLSVMGIQKGLVLKLVKYAKFKHDYVESGVALRKFIAHELGGSRLLFARVVEMWSAIEEWLLNSDPKSDLIGFNLLVQCGVLYIREVEGHPLSLRELAIDGNNVKSYGYRGKEIGERLQELLDFVLENPNENNPEILCARITSS